MDRIMITFRNNTNIKVFRSQCKIYFIYCLLFYLCIDIIFFLARQHETHQYKYD